MNKEKIVEKAYQMTVENHNHIPTKAKVSDALDISQSHVKYYMKSGSLATAVYKRAMKEMNSELMAVGILTNDPAFKHLDTETRSEVVHAAAEALSDE